MNRREFIKTTSALVVGLALPNFGIAKPDLLQIRRIPHSRDWDINGHTIEISKGPYKTSFGGCSDLLDCHGLCATDEMTQMVIDDLEIGGENLRLLSSNTILNRIALVRSLRRFHLSKDERRQIWFALKEDRGNHNCVHGTKRWNSITSKYFISRSPYE